MLLLSLICGADPALAVPPQVNILHGFASAGSHPNSIVEGSDGNFYGAASGTIFKLTPSGELSALHHLDLDPSVAWMPEGKSLVSGVDGNLYGTIATGGAHGGGSVFRLTLAGEFTTLCSFPADGAQSAPIAMIQASDGILYGLTRGANNTAGTFFKVTATGDLIVLRAFSPGEGSHHAALIEGADGYFYTVSSSGGSEGRGSLQQLSTTGELKTIYSFGSNGDQNYFPIALAQGGDGNFYVSSHIYGRSECNISQVTPSGILTVIHRFDQEPPSVLGPNESGSIYGFTRIDGQYRQGTLFQIAPNGGFSIVYNFQAADGSLPSSIVAGSDGAFYGTALYGGVASRGTAYRISASGQLTSLADFARSTEGFEPRALIQGSDGSFFGTTIYGGEFGAGTVFWTAASGETQILHAFNGGNEGGWPSKLVQSNDGNLYGFTEIGNKRSATLFRVTPDGHFTTLYTFKGGDVGSYPRALIKGNDGNIYGTVSDGGAHGHGMVFQLGPAGDLTTLYSFPGDAGGSSPGLLIQSRDGNLYGTALAGAGIVYKLTPSGSFTILAYSGVFSLSTTLVEGTDGNFYGTTPTIIWPGRFPPPPSNPTLFQVTPAGASKTIHTFPYGVDPTTLVPGGDGRLYGTTVSDGRLGGTTRTQMFSATPSGDITALHNFDLQTEGSNARALIQGADGNFYGTLASAGPAGGGAVFQLLLNPEPRPLNLSTRLNVLSGERVLIGGFIITGNEPKKVMIRGIGPSLSGVNCTLQDPTLELHQGSTTIATNDNWKTRADGTSQQAEIVATTISPTNDLESALIATLSPGTYTTILSGKNQGTGVGVVEVYDLAQSSNSQLANISSRGFVGTGNNVMIGGLIVGGSGNSGAKVMIRAIGPSLSGAGVTGALQDPTLELRDLNGALLVSNDDWKIRTDGTSQQAEIEATTIPPSNDQESALVSAIPPGTYTAIVRGKNSTTGIGLVEVYNLP